MKGSLRIRIRFFCVLLALEIVSWIYVEAWRPFPSIDGMSHSGPKDSPAPLNSPPQTTESEKVSEIKKEESFGNGKEGESKIGSSPPRCEHKCYGCTPCEAIQVPSTSSHLGIQYANYEPESWKCKCGPSFYSP